MTRIVQTEGTWMNGAVGTSLVIFWFLFITDLASCMGNYKVNYMFCQKLAVDSRLKGISQATFSD